MWYPSFYIRLPVIASAVNVVNGSMSRWHFYPTAGAAWPSGCSTAAQPRKYRCPLVLISYPRRTPGRPSCSCAHLPRPGPSWRLAVKSRPWPSWFRSWRVYAAGCCLVFLINLKFVKDLSGAVNYWPVNGSSNIVWEGEGVVWAVTNFMQTLEHRKDTGQAPNEAHCSSTISNVSLKLAYVFHT